MGAMGPGGGSGRRLPTTNADLAEDTLGASEVRSMGGILSSQLQRMTLGEEAGSDYHGLVAYEAGELLEGLPGLEEQAVSPVWFPQHLARTGTEEQDAMQVQRLQAGAPCGCWVLPARRSQGHVQPPFPLSSSETEGTGRSLQGSPQGRAQSMNPWHLNPSS